MGKTCLCFCFTAMEQTQWQAGLHSPMRGGAGSHWREGLRALDKALNMHAALRDRRCWWRVQARALGCVLIVAVMRLLNLAVPILYRDVVNTLADVSSKTHPPPGQPAQHFTFKEVASLPVLCCSACVCSRACTCSR